MTKYQFSLALFTSVFSMTSFSSSLQAACVTGDCAEMGYTKSENACSGDIIRCPFDTSKVFCKEFTSTKECNMIGDILYDDMTCASDISKLDASKTVIGVVASLSPRFAIDLEDLSNQSFHAGTGLSYCASYSPSNTYGWMLPQGVELQIIYFGLDKITPSLSKVSNKKLQYGFWSSTPAHNSDKNFDSYYYIGFWDGSLYIPDWDIDTYNVLCILPF